MKAQDFIAQSHPQPGMLHTQANHHDVQHWAEELALNLEHVWDSFSQLPLPMIAEVIQELKTELQINCLLRLETDQLGLVLSKFDIPDLLSLLQQADPRVFASFFVAMPSDVRVDLFQHMTQAEQAALLPYLSKTVREDLIQLSAYPPESAGGIMITDFATVLADMTCAEALAKIRQDAPSKRTIYYVYVVDADFRLVGFVTLKDLILSEPHTHISDVMHTQYVFAQVHEDREQVAQLVERYDLVALPVVNSLHQLVGIVTHDDVLDIIRAEHTEDMQKFMGIATTQQQYDYLNLSFWAHFRRRVVWVVSLAALGIVSGMIIHGFEGALEKLLILALYMPMVADTGGNCGSQAATLVVRALALGQIRVRDWLRVVAKELSVGLLLGVCLAILAVGKVFFLSWETDVPAQYSLMQIAGVIGLALGLQVVVSTLIGAMIPLIVKAAGGDPAVAASPAITTVVDITGLLIYFSLATLFLGL